MAVGEVEFCVRDTVVEDGEALIRFIEHMRAKGVRSYVGEVPLPSGKSVPINLSFEREAKPRRDREE